MTIKVEWDSPEKIAIRYEFGEEWTWEEFIAAAQADDELFNSVDHTVHVIFDARQLRSIPSNPTGRMRDFYHLIHPRLGLLVFVGTNIRAEIVLGLFYKIYGQTTAGMTGLKFVHTLDEARALIAAYP